MCSHYFMSHQMIFLSFLASWFQFHLVPMVQGTLTTHLQISSPKFQPQIPPFCTRGHLEHGNSLKNMISPLVIKRGIYTKFHMIDILLEGILLKNSEVWAMKKQHQRTTLFKEGHLQVQCGLSMHLGISLSAFRVKHICA
jgi:hypothetical protein